MLKGFYRPGSSRLKPPDKIAVFDAACPGAGICGRRK
jgi:hypothetical protein